MHEDVECELEDIHHSFFGHLCAREQAHDEEVELSADDIDDGVAIALLLDEGGDEGGGVDRREEEDTRQNEYLIRIGRFLEEK